MNNDPLDEVFETPEQSLAHYLNAMPKSLMPAFQREFMRRPTKRAIGQLPLCPKCGDTLFEEDRRWECVNESCGNCR